MKPVLAAAALLLAGCGSGIAEDDQNAAKAGAPDVAQLRCSGGPSLLTPVVRAQKDGVHVRVLNETSREVELDYEITSGGTGGGGSVAPVGPSEHVIPFGAKEISLGCSAEALSRVDLRVVDPNSVLKSPELECKAYSADPPTPPKGLAGGDPVSVTRRFLRGRGLRRGDVVEPALPIADEFETVRVVRNGRVVAAVWFDDPASRHHVGTVETCTDFQE